jgi:glycosyltransferase involved in cell wall biosynthesis
MNFTVLMCVNTDHEFLDAAINSVLIQDYPHFEFLIVANNCSDLLYEKLNSYKDDRIKLHRTVIGQLSFNLNYGINLSQGDYIIRMDSDDLCANGRLTKCLQFIDSNYDVVAFSADLIDEKSKVIGEKIIDKYKESDFFIRNFIIHPATMIKKSSLLKVKGYLGGFQSEDYDLWLRMSNQGFNFYFSADKVLSYRIREGQSKGSLLPYCEVSGYFLRDFLLKPNAKSFIGFCISIFKRIVR